MEKTTQAYKTINLDGETYTIKKMNAWKSTTMLIRLAKLLGEGVVKFMAVGAAKDEDVMRSIGEAIGSVILHADVQETKEVINDLLAEVMVGHTSQCVLSDFDTRFQDKLDHVFLLSKEVVNFNYERFFAKVAGLFQNLGLATKRPQT